MDTSDLIRERIQDDRGRFFANDNIAKYIHKVEIPELIEEVTQAFRIVLDALVIDIENDPNSKDTAKRLAKMFVEELFVGRYTKPPKATAFDNQGEYAYGGMLVVRAELDSVCAHHFQPMWGKCYIGIIPNNKVIGLSKYTRLAQWVARRGQIQESLTNQIFEVIAKETNTQDVAVYIALSHGCCQHRGIQAHSSLTQTTVLGGKFQTEPGVKEEFLEYVKLQEQFTDNR